MLLSKILEKFNRKERKIEKIIKDQNADMKFFKNVKFDCFGFYADSDKVPTFFIERDVRYNNKKLRNIDSVCAYTPKLLEFCVERLTDDALVDESLNIEDFKSLCNNYKEKAIFKSGWDEAIKRSAQHILQRAKEIELDKQ